MTPALPLSLEWQAPPGCPQAADIRAELSRIARPRTGASIESLHAIGSIERGSRGYVLRLTTETRGERGTTVLQAPKCDELQRAATLVLALVFGEDAELVDSAQPAQPPSPIASKPSGAPAPRRHEAAATTLSLEAGAGMAFGLLPHVATGPRAGALLRHQQWVWRAEGAAFFTGSAPLSARVSAVFWATQLRASTCYQTPSAVFRVGACLSAVAGTVHGTASGARDNRESFAPWYALGTSLLLSLRSSSRWEWGLNAGLDLVPKPPRFEVVAAGRFESAPLTPFLSLTVAVR